MTTPRQTPSAARSIAAQRGLAAEFTIAWLVLLAIAMSIVGSVAGYPTAEGGAKNGVRRAASQLERKVTKGDAALRFRATLAASGPLARAGASAV